MTESPHKLFQPIKVGNMLLSHRVVLAPLTRARASDDHVPSPVAATYYGQRASEPGTLLIAESAFIAAKTGGLPNVPGIYTEEQIAMWKKITDVVHAKKCFIFCQFFTMGRAAYPQVLEEEGPFPYVAPSPIGLLDRDATPRAMTTAELKEYAHLHVMAALSAVNQAGFDGIEIHCANGYLLDQFLQDTANQRDDEYGGSVENRARYPLEVIDAVTAAIGQERVGVRVSPWSRFQEMRMKDPIPTFTYFLTSLRERFPSLAYVHAIEPRVDGAQTREDAISEHESNDFIRELWAPRPLITAGGYTRALAIEAAEEHNVLVAFGRAFIANPDLPYRLKYDIPFTKGDRKTYYSAGNTGYTDYPFAT